MSGYNNVDEAFDYLNATCEDFAAAMAETRGFEVMQKAIEAMEFLAAKEANPRLSVEACKAISRAAPKVTENNERFKDATYRAELLRAKRDNARLYVNWMQSKLKADRDSYPV